MNGIKHITGYFIEEMIGMGGFADVYSERRDDDTKANLSSLAPDTLRAQDTLRPLDTIRDRRLANFAIKVLRKGISSPDIIARFEVERRLLEQFTHDGIVRVFESGLTDDGRLFFVMVTSLELPHSTTWEILSQTISSFRLTQ